MTQGRLDSREYKKLAALLTQWTGINLHAKEHLMVGRLQPRLRALKLAGFGDYLRLLEHAGPNGSEAQHFINALTTNKTSFFRESHHFDFLVKRLFPELRARPGPRRLRLWSAGCSRGAEPYTMAMLAAEQLPAAQGWDVKILATDLDTNVLADAQRAVYDEDEIADVPPALRKRFFARAGDAFQVQREAAALVTFAQANFIALPFPVRGRFDAIFCRNVMIYFDRPTQQRVVSELCKRIAPGGYLVIGHSESMLAQHLPRIHETVGVYQPVSAAAPARQPVLQPTAASTPPPRAATPTRARTATRSVAHATSQPLPTPSASRDGVRARAPVPGLAVKRIVLGEWFATSEPMLISTLLGSCVAACLFDPVARVGGMNHFMLPKVVQEAQGSARFGIHAMELLINELMQLGAQRARLRGMAFGAAAVNRMLTSTVAAQNGAFVRQFLAREQIPLVCERLGGERPREVYLRTDTGEAFVRNVEPNRAAQLQNSELLAYARKPEEQSAFKPEEVLF
ncbi:MAG: CheR family methyltransferase [Polyangiales bacterium]